VRKADIDEALALAIRAAERPSRSLVRAFRSGGVRVRLKPDRSFVTKHDVAAEAEIRAVLRASPRFGSFDIEGEESGRDGRSSEYRWLIDPIDGTTSFLRGIATFGTIVALEETTSRRAVLGAIHLPMQGETYAAGCGLGAWCGATRIRVSKCRTLSEALVSAPDAQWFHKTRLEAGYRRLRQVCAQLRGYCDIWAHTMVMRGAVDALWEPYNNAWDIRATEVMVAEAGGICMTRPVKGGKFAAALFGSRPVVEQIADVTGF
jgi:fructose-1,6-bisphosphatase/inositol monophosphatase family enzyme